ncbi:MAG: hypothetical protein KKD38_09255 [Candidatus Delongbacteria bacterium]|nr:hypothetical protein [Candidatus Delongbacteria bacterium]
MKKIVAFVVILIMAISLSAQFKTGMAFRTRAEIFCTNEDVQVWRRITDLRFNPWISYTQNEYLTAKAEFEIGDIGFGNMAQGGALGTDSVNVKTKNLFMQITPNKDNIVVVGLQPYKDFHSLLLNWDLAGISWKNKYKLQGKELTSFLAWFVSEDNDEKYIDETTYSFGNTEFVADFEYQINKEMKVGVNNLMEFVRKPTDALNVHRTELNLWSAPYFAGTFNKLYVEAVLGANNIRPNNEVIYGDGNEGYTPEHTGIIFSLKTKYDVNEEASARFNFLFRDADTDPTGGNDSYYGLHSYYSTGLEILTESGYGLDKIDDQVFSPLTSYPKSDLDYVHSGYGGIILPVIFFDYNATKYMKKLSFINNMKLSLGMGHAVTAYKIYRVTGSDNKARPETWIGTELDFKAEIKMFDDLDVLPYFAILFPGEWYDYEGGHKPFTKIGLTLNTKIK